MNSEVHDLYSRRSVLPFPGTIIRMRAAWTALLVAVVSMAPCYAVDDTSQPIAILPCPTANASCQPSKSDLKKAKEAFHRGLKLENQKKKDEAFTEFDTAARLAPTNIDYVTALALLRQQLVSEHIQKGNAALMKNLPVEAQAEFRSALALDPTDSFAQERLKESLGEWDQPERQRVEMVEDSGLLAVVPSDSLHSFHFRGDSKTLLTQVAAAYGIAAELDDSVVARRVHFDIDNVDFYTAMHEAGDVTGSFWTPLSDKQAFVLKNTGENHRLYDRMALRRFRVIGSHSFQDTQQIITMLRSVFEIRFLHPSRSDDTFLVRAPLQILDAVSVCLEAINQPRMQVLLDVKVYQIDHQLTRNIGVHIPNTFTLFNIPAAAFAALGAASGQNIQSLINQLISGGGINGADSQALSGLLSQLQGQSSGIFSQPLATFGGGLTLMGLTLDQLSAQLSLNESWVKILDHATLRAESGSDTTFRMGQRYPVINASFAPVFNTSAISQVIQNGSFQAPIPSFNYEDLGLDIKAKPVVSYKSTVGLQLEMRLRTLAGQSLNGVPIISNREYKGSINLEDGEPATVASTLTHSEMLTIMGVPGLGAIPGLKSLATENDKTAEDDELLVIITPHVEVLNEGHNAEVWLRN